MKKIPIVFVLLTFATTSVSAADSKPKYGPEAKRIYLSHDYFKKNPAPDFWALIPYYAAQRDEASCSLASVTMVVNAARAAKDLTADDELATQDTVLKKTDDASWAIDLKTKGVTLEELGKFTEEALKAYGIPSKVEVLHADMTPEFKKKLAAVLSQNEKSAQDFVIANFLQGTYTGDAAVGHIAPVAAYDQKNQRVLVLDPDRKWYEPYWVSLDTFIQGMSTTDKVSGKNRGLIWIQLR